ncbi:MAG: FHIPEP family type III secretion protein [Phycisphaerae bacterium]|nr:FHIPEP family type III secretion protein [Phycisphaerae bacterium]
MSDAPTSRRLMAAAHRHRGLLLPLAAAGLIFAILVPLPPGAVDVLLSANLALAACVLLTAIYVSRPLEFSVFPSLLLGATLLRLVLNVATTRLILTAGENGRTAAQAQLAAGQVVWSFSEFVAAGSLVAGAVVFAIVVIVQFVVVTKGAGRISEVAARFVLDAMPGKQMAVDADLKAGLINDAEALRRRDDVARQADFYGAMDGASKFLRGDAVAAVIITLINILGGLYVGMVRYGWSWDETSQLFTRLTIGDGLVTQIPAFIVSVAAALMVTRRAARSNLGEEVIAQLASRPAVLAVTAVFLSALALTSLPKLPLLFLAGGCAGLAWLLGRRNAGAPRAGASDGAESRGRRTDTGRDADQAGSDSPGVGASARETTRVSAARQIDPLRIELGFALVRLADSGQLLDRIAVLRDEIGSELGLVAPPVRVRDNLRLAAHEYRIGVRDAAVATGMLYAGRLLAVPGAHAAGKLEGREGTEPVSGLPAVWIEPGRADRATRMGYRTVAPEDVLMAHLGRVVRVRAAELLSREQVAEMLASLEADHPHLVAEARQRLSLARIQKLLRRLLGEAVPIRDLETILEAATDAAEGTDRIDEITEQVRAALAPALRQQYASSDGRIWCVRFKPELENAIHAHVHDTPQGPAAALPPALAGRIADAVTDELARLRREGRRGVVLCAPALRSAVRTLLAPSDPDAAVLAYNEVTSADVQSAATVAADVVQTAEHA